MGVSCPNETKCLSKILSNGATLRRNFYAEFEPTFSAQGKFRYCYKGTIKNLDGDAITNYDFPSGKCVVKVYKDEENIQDYLLDFIGSQFSHEMAILFNQVIGIPNKLNFILPYAGSVHLLAGFKLFGLFKVSTNDDSKRYLSPNMKVAIEPFLNGEYIKFSSNSGYENQNYNAYIPAFSHFTWIYSKGKRVVMDVQGIFKNQRYYLTDPAVQTLEGNFGNSDLGAMSLCKFIIFHKHNNICANWKWIPANFDGILKACNATSIKRTSFKFENRKNIEKYKPIYQYLLNNIKFD